MKYTIAIVLLFSLRILLAQEVVKVSISPCDTGSHPEYIYPNRLISKNLDHDTLHFDIGLVRNCSFEPEITLEQRNDSLIVQIENVSDISMACLCCYTLSVSAIGLKDTNFILVNQYIEEDISDTGFEYWTAYTEIKKYPNKFIFPSLSEIESAKPLNKMTIDSLKVGTWHFIDTTTNSLKAKSLFYIDDMGTSRAKWYVIYNEEGEIIEVCGLTGIDSKGVSNINCLEIEQYLKLEIEDPK